MYNGDASQRAFALYISCMTTHDLACCNFSILNFVTMTFFHACMHAHVCFTCMRSIIYIYIYTVLFSRASGAELKKMFQEAGGNWTLVEIQAKKWVSDQKTSEEVTGRVTKRMLKEKYFWDES